MRVLVSFVFTMTLISNQIEETPKLTKDKSNHYCSHQNVHSLAIRRVFQFWVLPASLLPTWGIAPKRYYEGQSVLVYVGITSGAPRLVADVLVSDRSRVIIGTQDLRVSVSRREAFLAALVAGSTYWHLYQLQRISQAIDVKNVNWLCIATFSHNCPLLCCVVLLSKFVVLR